MHIMRQDNVNLFPDTSETVDDNKSDKVAMVVSFSRVSFRETSC